MTKAEKAHMKKVIEEIRKEIARLGSDHIDLASKSGLRVALGIVLSNFPEHTL